MQQPTGFRDLLNAMMKRRWWITALVLGGFVVIMGAIFMAIFEQQKFDLARFTVATRAFVSMI